MLWVWWEGALFERGIPRKRHNHRILQNIQSCTEPPGETSYYWLSCLQNQGARQRSKGYLWPLHCFFGPGPLTSQCNPSIGTPPLMYLSRTSILLLYLTLSMMRLASGWRRNWDILRCLFLSPAILIPVDHIHDFAKLHSQKQKATHISQPKRLFLLSLLHVWLLVLHLGAVVGFLNILNVFIYCMRLQAMLASGTILESKKKRGGRTMWW